MLIGSNPLLLRTVPAVEEADKGEGEGCIQKIPGQAFRTFSCFNLHVVYRDTGSAARRVWNYTGLSVCVCVYTYFCLHFFSSMSLSRNGALYR